MICEIYGVTAHKEVQIGLQNCMVKRVRGTYDMHNCKLD